MATITESVGQNTNKNKMLEAQWQQSLNQLGKTLTKIKCNEAQWQQSLNRLGKTLTKIKCNEAVATITESAGQNTNKNKM